jgi:chromosome segregation ATPase
MPKTQLQERIRELLRELEQIETAESSARDRLTKVLEEIREAVEAEEAGAPETLIERLNEATRHFEESHPTLTSMVGRVADSLANLGI